MMKYVFLVLVVIVTNSLVSAASDWVGGVPPNGSGIPVDAVYFHPEKDDPSQPDYIGFWSGGVFYKYAYMTDPDGEITQNAKAVLSMLLSAKSGCQNVSIYRPNSLVNEFKLIIVR